MVFGRGEFDDNRRDVRINANRTGSPLISHINPDLCSSFL